MCQTYENSQLTAKLKKYSSPDTSSVYAFGHSFEPVKMLTRMCQWTNPKEHGISLYAL